MITIIKQTLVRFIDREGFDSASILSFSTLFAIVPGLALGLSVFSLSPYFAELQQHLEQFLFNQLLPQNYAMAKDYIQQFISHAQGLKGFSSLFLLVAVLFLLYEIDKRINFIWHDEHHRHWMHSLLSYTSVLFLGPILVGTSLLVSSYVIGLEFFNQFLITTYAPIFIALMLSISGFTILYYATPTKKIRLTSAFKAGVITTIGLEILKYVFLIYIQYFPVYELIYGTLSILMLAMLWVYLAWIIVLFGASFCYCLESK
ncbi:Inner membrane protein YihY, formerly thought to be RNase BN [hydrothermal vent metagenome]|uniref:Inner membrane protein YihY, formerly thought to be RNase BN n=1 Tax=hydrothermal vent metagenome TaxID=652676 RepID=A0A1W1DZF3_9ZZZZ